MDLLLEKSGDDQPEGVHADPHKGFDEKGTSLCRVPPLYFFISKEVGTMVVQGDKQLMLKLVWEMLRKLLRRVLRRL